jgi:hypothetical protein
VPRRPRHALRAPLAFLAASAACAEPVPRNLVADEPHLARGSADAPQVQTAEGSARARTQRLVDAVRASDVIFVQGRRRQGAGEFGDAMARMHERWADEIRGPADLIERATRPATSGEAWTVLTRGARVPARDWLYELLRGDTPAADPVAGTVGPLPTAPDPDDAIRDLFARIEQDGATFLIPSDGKLRELDSSAFVELLSSKWFWLGTGLDRETFVTALAEDRFFARTPYRVRRKDGSEQTARTYFETLLGGASP